MSQAVLSIDASCSPSKMVVASVQGRSIEILESRSVDLNFIFTEENQNEQEENGTPENTADGEDLNPLQQALVEIKTPWYNSVLVMPQDEHLSLNLDLPFSDSKKIEKILPLEIQDIVPFNVGEFVIDHTVVGGNGSGKSDVHVAMVPHNRLRKILSALQTSGIDPICVSPAPGILGAVYRLAPDYFQPNSAVVWAESNTYAVLVSIDGQFKYGRTIDTLSLPAVADISLEIMQTIRLTVAYCEKRYGSVLDEIYLFGSSLSGRRLQEVLGRRVEKASVSELVKNGSEDNSLASLAAFYGQDSPDMVLSNFRIGEFAYRPRFRELLTGLKSLSWFVVFLVFSIMLFLGVSYYIKDREVAALKSDIHKNIVKYIPDLKPVLGSELSQIQDEISNIQTQLEELGSLSHLSALDVFLELSNDLPKGSDFSIYNLSIKGSRVSVKGFAERYSTIDKIEDALKKKKNVYCKVDVRTDSIITKTNQFELILEIC